MAKSPLRIGIIANINKPSAREVLAQLMAHLQRVDLECLVESDSAAILDGAAEGLPLDELVEKIDLLIVLGGDGTILNAARRMGSKSKPIMGVNIGTLGFLTCCTQNSLDRVAEWILEGSFRLSTRVVIQASVYEGDRVKATYFGLNEVTVSRGSVSRIIQLETWIDGEFVNSYSGDGLIIATPTGSTAYSLSAGGPVIDPESGVFVITPICPHTLSNRSMVVQDSATIEILPVKARDEVMLTLDGQTLEELQPESRVCVRRAPHVMQLALRPEQSFYRTLRKKLQWHGSHVQ